MLLVLAVIIEALFLTQLRWGDLRSHVLDTIWLQILINIFYLTGCWFVLSRNVDRNQMRIIPLAAIAFRLTAWPIAPALSDDVYRYRWEGKLQAHGGNPYQVRPADPAAAEIRDEVFSRVPLKDFKAGYGPLVEQLEVWTYRLTERFWPGDAQRQVFWFKLPAAIGDLGIILALAALLSACGLPVARIIVYAWSPLPVMEFWATGHNDAIVVALLLLAMVLAQRKQWWRAYASLGMAVAAKWWPLALLPLFLARRRGPEALLVAAIPALLFIPYWGDVVENARFMTGFFGGWRNNDSIYGLILWLTGDVYRAKYTTFALLGIGIAVIVWRRMPLERGVLASIILMLMLSANVHPWYLTWVLPLLAFIPEPGLLTWAALAPLFYEALFAWHAAGVWNGVSDIRWLVYVPVYGLLVYRFWVSRAARKPLASAVADPLPQ